MSKRPEALVFWAGGWFLVFWGGERGLEFVRF